jgi:glycosyltransferase involved in cell wall biosynthesis
MNISTANKPQVAVVMPVGPGKEAALDTLQSIEAYCPEPHLVFIIDDRTTDGTYEALLAAKKPHWYIFRNQWPHKIERLAQSLGHTFEQIVAQTECEIILKIDTDALIIKPGLFPEALAYHKSNPSVGVFGVHEVDYNRPRSFEFHKRMFDRESAWYRSLIGQRPFWKDYLKLAESRGYKRGDNVFGGAYFVTRQWVEAAVKMGALKIPWRWHSNMGEEIYFSMIAVAAGLRLGHFAAPDGPLIMEWRGLPYPAEKLIDSKYKLVHSVDKGPNTGPADNGGRTAREVFRALRNATVSNDETAGSLSK